MEEDRRGMKSAGGGTLGPVASAGAGGANAAGDAGAGAQVQVRHMVPVTKEDWRGIKSVKPRAAAAGPPASADPAPVWQPAAISLEELSECMHMPLKMVAQEKGICLTTLKKACRMHGIKRWPFRKLRSIERAASLELAVQNLNGDSSAEEGQEESGAQAERSGSDEPSLTGKPAEARDGSSNKRPASPPPAAAAGGPGGGPEIKRPRTGINAPSDIMAWMKGGEPIAPRTHALCPHKRREHDCKECGGASICEHKRFKSICRECGGTQICPHNRLRSTCRECGGGSICPHMKIKHRCAECGGNGVCKHKKRKSECRECSGATLCEHGKIKRRCTGRDMYS